MPRSPEPNILQKIWDDPELMEHITKALMGLLAVLLVLGSIWWCITRPMFTLSEITVHAEGNKELHHVNAPVIKNTAIQQLKGNFFTISLEDARRAFETVTWVRKAAVRREWPNKLIISIEEHVPVGTWGDDGRLLSDKGVVFVANTAEAEEYGQMLEFEGPDGSEQDVAKRFMELQQWFAQIKLLPVGVILSNRLSWTVKLHNGMVIELGRDETPDAVKSKIDRLISVYPQLTSRLGRNIERVDLRYPNGMAIKANGLKLKPETKKSLPQKT